MKNYITKAKEYLKKNGKRIAKDVALVCVAGGVWYVVYTVTGKKDVEEVVNDYKDFDIPEFAKGTLDEVWDSRTAHETVALTRAIHLNEFGEVGEMIAKAYDIDPTAPTIAQISIAN